MQSALCHELRERGHRKTEKQKLAENSRKVQFTIYKTTKRRTLREERKSKSTSPKFKTNSEAYLYCFIFYKIIYIYIHHV